MLFNCFLQPDLDFQEMKWKWQNYQSKNLQYKKGTAALLRDAISVVTLESPDCLPYRYPVLGSKVPTGLWIKGVKSMLKAKRGWLMFVKIKGSFFLATKKSSLKTIRERCFFPMSIQPWRHSFSDIGLSSKNSNEVFCVVTQ